MKQLNILGYDRFDFSAIPRISDRLIKSKLEADSPAYANSLTTIFAPEFDDVEVV